VTRNRPYKDLETALGYRFKDAGLLREALTHSSARQGGACAADNERLEFLGDRVLGLAIAELILEAFPEAREGELARRFNRLVQREACARVARELGLGQHVILAGAEAAAGGREKDGILADACEAVLGAVLLEGGYVKAQKIVATHWLPQLRDAGPAIIPDPKTALQEWAQGRGKPIPVYSETGRTGPAHAPRFTSTVTVEGVKPATGTGTSKRAAERDAARILLEREGLRCREDG
jgi:ribonuclease-3